MSNKERVCYYYDADVGNFHYGEHHPMKPFRITLCHELVVNYGLYRHMSVYRPHMATAEEMARFHSEEYVNFLKSVTPDNYRQHTFQLEQFMLGPRSDCPIFSGVFEFNQRSVGGSIDGALRLAHNKCDIAVNWSGGFHHAKKSEASGFCYINDIVLSILELLKYYARVLYIDIDIHHGDGVEEAFYTCDRVCTLSFHKYGDFFPGTGHWKDIGVKDGKNFSINFPLDEGIDDENYFIVFKKVFDEVMRKYRPECIVLQCGADSLARDRIGIFNLSSRGHGRVVSYVKSLKVPTLVLGGGGYNIKNVARCWTYETSLLTNIQVSEDVPYTEFSRYYGPNFKLHVEPRTDLENKNTKKYLEEMTAKVLENVKGIDIAPNVQFMEKAPDTLMSAAAEDDDPDVRMSEKQKDEHIVPRNEIYAHDKDQDGDDPMDDAKPIN